MFSEQVSKQLNNYVYRLIDPRNGETFYVGKGKGNRVFDHATGVKLKAIDDDSDLSDKHERILAILNAKLEVMHVIHRHDLSDEAVFEVEAALIDAFPGLTNAQGGHGSNSKGPMNHLQIIRKYELPELDAEISEKLVLININALEILYDREAIYDQVRFSWRISANRARKADYVLAVVRGVVVGAFVAHEWLLATRENFPDISDADRSDGTRYGFKGAQAPSDIWERFVGADGKRVINNDMKHIQYPIRYWKV